METPFRKRLISIGIAVFFFILLFSFIGRFYTRIDAGHVGLKINMSGSDRGVSDITEVTGFVWFTPWLTKIEEFPTFTQTVDYQPFTVNTNDGASFTVDPTLTYHPDPTKVPQIYRQYRRPLPLLEQTIIRNMVFDAYRLTTNEFKSDSLVGQRARFEAKVEAELRKSLKEDGFIYERLTSAVTPPPSLQAAIDAKNTAVQTAMALRNKIESEKAQAEIAITRATGAARAKLIGAQAESEANALKQRTLTPMLIQQQWIEKWDGKLPTTSTGAASLMLGLKP